MHVFLRWDGSETYSSQRLCGGNGSEHTVGAVSVAGVEHCWALALCGALDAQLRAIITLSLPQLPRASKHICFHTVINYEL